MSEHRHRRRRRTSGFDLVRLYEDEHHVLDRCAREHRNGLLGWALVAAAGLFSLLLVWIAMGPGIPADGARSTSGAHWAATPPAGSAQVYLPPDSATEELTNPGSAVVVLLVVLATLVVSGMHLALGRGESDREGGSDPGAVPVTEAPVAEPSAFERRLDEMVCIKMSRRPQSHGHRHHY